MFIIPFIHKTKQVNTMTIHTIQVLTVGGTTLWKENPSLALEADILHPNGIYLDKKPFQWNDVHFCSVDTNKTDMNDFYQWSEIPNPVIECHPINPRVTVFFDPLFALQLTGKEFFLD
jgi:hypothetical protein